MFKSNKEFAFFTESSYNQMTKSSKAERIFKTEIIQTQCKQMLLTESQHFHRNASYVML